MGATIDRTKTKPKSPANVLDRAIAIAEHYGFHDARKAASLLPRPPQTATGNFVPTTLRDCNELAMMKKISAVPAAVVSGALRKQLIEPILLYTLNQETSTKGKQGGTCQLSLEALGIPGSLGEALTIRTALAILEETGQPNTFVEINSLGDRDSFARFLRDCLAFYRRYIETIHAYCRNNLRKNPLIVLECGHRACKALRDEAPRPINYLSEASRRHFKEVLEYLELLQVPYRISETLVASRHAYTKTVFAIRPDSPELFEETAEKLPEPSAFGGRYDDFARRIGGRADIPATGITLTLHTTRSGPSRRTEQRPRAYFIQIGPEARRKGLIVLEILRRASVPVCQSLGTDKLTGQLMAAEGLGVPYTIIMGHKEALEESVIVRRTDTRSQETVPIAELGKYARMIR